MAPPAARVIQVQRWKKKKEKYESYCAEWQHSRPEFIQVTLTQCRTGGVIQVQRRNYVQIHQVQRQAHLQVIPYRYRCTRYRDSTEYRGGIRMYIYIRYRDRHRYR